MEQCDEAESFCSWDQLNNAKYVNDTVINGTLCQEFDWHSYLGPISMANTQMYLVKDAPTLTPLFRVMELTPFGNYFGNITQVYGNFTAGTPPDSAWAVPYANTCEQGSDADCEDDSLRAKGVPLHMLPSFLSKMLRKMRY